MAEMTAIWLITSEDAHEPMTLLEARPYVPGNDPPTTYTDANGSMYLTVASNQRRLGTDTIHEVSVIAID